MKRVLLSATFVVVMSFGMPAYAFKTFLISKADLAAANGTVAVEAPKEVSKKSLRQAFLDALQRSRTAASVD